MGIQDRGEVSLIRHAYVQTVQRRKGIGEKLLKYLEGMTAKPILIGHLERCRVGDRLLREERLPGSLPPRDRTAAAQNTGASRAADRDVGRTGEWQVEVMSGLMRDVRGRPAPHVARGRETRPRLDRRACARASTMAISTAGVGTAATSARRPSCVPRTARSEAGSVATRSLAATTAAAT